MNPKLTTIVAVAALVLGWGSLARANNLVVNGGFESGDFSGWTQAGDPTWTTVYDNTGYKWWALSHSGNDRAVLGPGFYDGTLTQHLNTTAGNTYTLSFWLANDSPPYQSNAQFGNSFAVSWGGQTLLSMTDAAPFHWTLYYFYVSGAGPGTPLQFSFFNYIGYYYLDDVALDGGTVIFPPQIPEPSGLVLMGTGMLGLGALVRRGRQNKLTPGNLAQHAAKDAAAGSQPARRAHP